MLIKQSNGTWVAGIADIIYIIKLRSSGRFHVVFAEEHPMPGPVKPVEEQEYIRLKSKMHHTGGAATLLEAQGHLDELRTKIIIPDTNVARDSVIEIEDPVSVFALRNWIKEKRPVSEVFA